MTELPPFLGKGFQLCLPFDLFLAVNYICLFFPLMMSTWCGSDCISSWVYFASPEGGSFSLKVIHVSLVCVMQIWRKTKKAILRHKYRHGAGYKHQQSGANLVKYNEPSLYRHSIQRQFRYNDNLNVTKSSLKRWRLMRNYAKALHKIFK